MSLPRAGWSDFAGNSASAVVPLSMKMGTPSHMPSYNRLNPSTSMYHCVAFYIAHGHRNMIDPFEVHRS